MHKNYTKMLGRNVVLCPTASDLVESGTCLCDCFANTTYDPTQCPNCNSCNNMTVTPSEYHLLLLHVVCGCFVHKIAHVGPICDYYNHGSCNSTATLLSVGGNGLQTCQNCEYCVVLCCSLCHVFLSCALFCSVYNILIKALYMKNAEALIKQGTIISINSLIHVIEAIIIKFYCIIFNFKNYECRPYSTNCNFPYCIYFSSSIECILQDYFHS